MQVEEVVFLHDFWTLTFVPPSYIPVSAATAHVFTAGACTAASRCQLPQPPTRLTNNIGILPASSSHHHRIHHPPSSPSSPQLSPSRVTPTAHPSIPDFLTPVHTQQQRHITIITCHPFVMVPAQVVHASARGGIVIAGLTRDQPFMCRVTYA